MANIQFRTGEATTNGHLAQLVVDGVDITNHVLMEGFAIMPSGTGPDAEWVVQIRLGANIDADLPEAVVNARPSEADGAAYSAEFAEASDEVAKCTAELAAINTTLATIAAGQGHAQKCEVVLDGRVLSEAINAGIGRGAR